MFASDFAFNLTTVLELTVKLVIILAIAIALNIT